MKSGSIRTSDGSELWFLERGHPQGFPILWLHGTPGSRLSQALPERDLLMINARVITYDRPGYGLSTRRRGRKVVDSVADVACVADHLQLDTFMVSGRSGGGPHALALAAGLPERVTRVRSVSGFAPYLAFGLDWFDGMDPNNVQEFQSALLDEDSLTRVLTREAEDMLQRLRTGPSEFLAAFDLTAADRAATQDPFVQKVLRVAIPEALRNGIHGWVDDDLAVVQDWGFDVAEISTPVEVQYGLQDVVVPPGHGVWLTQNIPGAIEIREPEAGHISTPRQELAMLQDMLGAA